MSVFKVTMTYLKFQKQRSQQKLKIMFRKRIQKMFSNSMFRHHMVLLIYCKLNILIINLQLFKVISVEMKMITNMILMSLKIHLKSLKRSNVSLIEEWKHSLRKNTFLKPKLESHLKNIKNRNQYFHLFPFPN